MRRMTARLTLLALVFCCFGGGRAQRLPDDVIVNVELAMKEMELEWRCARVHTPQGEPGPESPRGTKYQFRCQHKNMAASIFILYGETKLDAEKALALSQRLQVNESKPVEGIGEQGYQLAKERFAWITFRKARVYGQINVGIPKLRETDGPSEMPSTTASALIDAAKLFARLVADHIPAK